MSLPSVNIIIPVLNGERTLGLCLEAITRQTYGGEIIPVVINDGSADRTSEIALSFKNIHLIEQENRGRSAARNRGIIESNAEILAFTDADCVPAPDWLKMLVKRLTEKDKHRGIVGGSIVLPERSNIWQLLDHQAWAHSIGPGTAGGPTLFGSTANMCMFRTTFEQVGGFDHRLQGSEDSDLAFRLYKAGYENYFEPGAVVEHHHGRSNFISFVKQRYNYGRWTIQSILKHKPLPPYSWIFPCNRLALASLWPVYTLLATAFTFKRNWRSDKRVAVLLPLHCIGRAAEYAGTVAGCGEYKRKFEIGKNKDLSAEIL